MSFPEPCCCCSFSWRRSRRTDFQWMVGCGARSGVPRSLHRVRRHPGELRGRRRLTPRTPSSPETRPSADPRAGRHPRSAGRAARTGALSTMARYRSRSYRTERTKHQDRLRGSGHPGGGISRRLSPPGRPARSNAAPVPDFHRGGVWHHGPGAAVAGQPRHALHRPRAEGHRPDAKRMAA